MVPARDNRVKETKNSTEDKKQANSRYSFKFAISEGNREQYNYAQNTSFTNN